jgi:SAM-dependent MidA family methyltransferase
VSDALPRLIRDEILARGPMTFARFMELALAEPELGYYAQPAARPTREGDFLTAPELHPVFGRVLARQVDDCWRLLGSPDPFTIREYGAGSGALAAAIVDGLRADGSGLLGRSRAGAPNGPGASAAAAASDAAGASAAAGAPAASPEAPTAVLRYEPVELNAYRRAELRERLATAAPEVAVTDPTPGRPVVGVVLANEFIDALPVHRVAMDCGVLREVLVGWEDDATVPDRGRLVDVVADPTTPALAARLHDEGVRLAEGQLAEVRLADEAWLDEIARDLGRGYVIAIDYGAPAADLYDPTRRPVGTLLAYRGHRVHDDVLADPGEQDITAHVDLTALDRAGSARGLAPIGRTTQARFLAGCGLGDLLEAVRSDPATTFEGYLAFRSALGRLLDPRAMGGFAVVVLGRGLTPGAERLRGLSEAAPG